MQTSSGVQSHTTGSIALLTRSLTSGPLEVIAWQSLGRPTRPNISPAQENVRSEHPRGNPLMWHRPLG